MPKHPEPLYFIALRGQDRPHAFFTPQHAGSLAPAPLPVTQGALAQWLPAQTQEELSRLRASGQSGLLLLDPSLPQAWQHAPWEDLYFEGTPLPTTLLSVRRATPVFEACRPASAQSAWLNLFPRAEFDFASALQAPIRAEQLQVVRPRWLGQGLDGYSDLFILAHGDKHGLLDQRGSPFTLDHVALPRRVWLLACNLDTAMYRLAEALLARGVRTVVTATGEIAAPEMAALLMGWCERADALSPEEWLLKHRRHARVGSGAHALTLFGEVVLDASDNARWNEISWTHWCAPRSELPRLVDQEEAEFQHILRATESSGLWPQTLNWLLPQALSAAENWDHGAMPRLQRLCTTVASASPSCAYALANAFYREGRYQFAARYAVEGLSHGAMTPAERAELLGSITNLLIDMALPGAALNVAKLHAECHIDDPTLLARQEFKRLDWLARIALRQHRFEDALHLLAIKRGRRTDQNDTRELAWRLYASAWQLHAEQAAAQLINDRDEVLKVLEGQLSDKLGKGNDGTAYLLRALACCRWSSADTALNEPLQRWLPLLHTGLSTRDPGPWAFAGCYLALSDPRFSRLGQHALASLESAGYWLEVAGFAALGVAPASVAGALQKHAAMRTQVLAHLMPWLESVGVKPDPETGIEHLPPL